ncbi:MAG: small multi-drug export protein [Patescibacteria group bacterium]
MQDFFIILLSAVPIGELRVALPLALEGYGFSIPRALVDVYLGNALPVLPLLFGLNALTIWSDKHWPFFHRLLDRFFLRTRRRLQGDYQIYGAMALFLFVAIPLPLTGVWTASVAAVLFGIRPRPAATAILGGMVLAGLIVLLVTKGVVTGIRLL